MRLMKDGQVMCDEADPERAANLLLNHDLFDGVHPGDAHLFACRDLTRLQFDVVLELLGMSFDDLVEAARSVISDPVEKAKAAALIRNAHTFRRSNPLFDALKATVGLTDGQIDTAWATALDAA